MDDCIAMAARENAALLIRYAVLVTAVRAHRRHDLTGRPAPVVSNDGLAGHRVPPFAPCVDHSFHGGNNA